MGEQQATWVTTQTLWVRGQIFSLHGSFRSAFVGIGASLNPPEIPHSAVQPQVTNATVYRAQRCHCFVARFAFPFILNLSSKRQKHPQHTKERLRDAKRRWRWLSRRWWRLSQWWIIPRRLFSVDGLYEILQRQRRIVVQHEDWRRREIHGRRTAKHSRGRHQLLASNHSIVGRDSHARSQLEGVREHVSRAPRVPGGQRQPHEPLQLVLGTVEDVPAEPTQERG